MSDLTEFIELLGIDQTYIKREDEDGLKYAAALWKEAGAPTVTRRLHNTLEHILIVCRRDGVRYPPVLLLRFKNLERGLWEPNRKSPIPQGARTGPAAASPGGVCSRCHGTGLRTVLKDGVPTGVVCDCKPQVKNK